MEMKKLMPILRMFLVVCLFFIAIAYVSNEIREAKEDAVRHAYYNAGKAIKAHVLKLTNGKVDVWWMEIGKGGVVRTCYAVKDEPRTAGESGIIAHCEPTEEFLRRVDAGEFK